VKDKHAHLAGTMAAALPSELAQFFSARGWRLRRHQADMLAVAAAGSHALLVAETGAGKTLGGFLPSLAAFCPSRLAGAAPPEGLHTLYVSPLKALAHDVQRNLLAPVAELGLPMRVEVRSGDTPSERKARQRANPPHVLLTTPESLSLLLSYPEAETLFAGLQRVVIDEIHAFAPTKRGDLLALALTRLQTLSPNLQRVGLSATLANPDDFARWLAPVGSADSVVVVEGEKGADPELSILLPEEARVPWGGHAATWAVPQLYREIKANRTTLIFCNTRFLAEFIFQQLWDVNDDVLPIGIHHGSLSKEARRKVEGAMARGELRALVCTASLDLGVDWGDIDLVVQMGAPKGSSRLLQRIGRAGHRLDQASRALLVPGNRFEFLEAMAAQQAVEEGQRDGEAFRPGALDVLAQHVMARACAGPFAAADLLKEVQTAEAYRWFDAPAFERVVQFVATGGYSLRAYDRFQRITQGRDGLWRLTHPEHAARFRLNAGIIVDSEMVDVRFRNGRALGRVEESFSAALRPGDTIRFAGLDLEVEAMRESELIVRAAKKAGQIPSYMGQRLALTTHLAERVQALLDDRAGWARFPDDVREWLEVHLAVWGLRPVAEPASLLSPDILAHEFVDWVQQSYLLRRAFREVAVIAGLVERQHPGKRKSGKQVTFSTDLIFDVLQKHEPDHLLIEAAWADARTRLTDVARIADVLERAAAEVDHVVLERVTPLAVPLLTMIGRESLPPGQGEDELLVEAESLAAAAMRV